MQKKTFEIPAMYGDHHVTEVRSLLLSLPGVTDVYASSAFQVVEVTYDETKTNDLEISVKLDQAGYLGEWSFPMEIGAVQSESGNGGRKPFFRHTEVFQNSRQVVSFAQNIDQGHRPLWPCPGFDRSNTVDE